MHNFDDGTQYAVAAVWHGDVIAVHFMHDAVDSV